VTATARANGVGCSVSYTVRHHYHYEYTAPVSHVQQRLIMVPPNRHGDQVLTAFELEVRGASGQMATDWQTDSFGNRVCSVSAERVDHAVDFEASFSVRREPRATPAPDVDQNQQRWPVYLSFTALTMPDERIRAVAREIAAGASTPLVRVHRACNWVAHAIQYQAGITGTRTPAAMALHLGRGVCQDYAHILLSLLRSLRIAARYVSGHLPGEGAPHAWVEALVADPELDEQRVVGCDPTHQCTVGPDYIVVAAGRDFADVTSTSGVFTGGATGTLHWSKHASRLMDCARKDRVSLAR
jgi:transglutaminase-like putative cysteine protease